MITIGFFFLCCRREHTVTFDNKPFKLSNVQFYNDNKPVPIQSSKLLHTADFLTLTFDTQKNGVKGKRIGHGCSTSATLCPILAVAHRVAHLNLHKAKPHQPLCSYYHTASSSYCYLASQDITQVLQASALHHLHFCVNPASVKCRSYAPVVLWHFSLAGWMPCSSNLLAAGILMQCSATCMSSPASSCQDYPNSCWLVAIPSS